MTAFPLEYQSTTKTTQLPTRLQTQQPHQGRIRS
jgi:hypothetical protein